MILLIRRLPAITFSTADESGRLDGVSRRLCARYAALITNARMRPSIGPLPNRRARAAVACSVACSRPEAARASISLRSGVPSQKTNGRIARRRRFAFLAHGVNRDLRKARGA